VAIFEKIVSDIWNPGCVPRMYASVNPIEMCVSPKRATGNPKESYPKEFGRFGEFCVIISYCPICV
jgi:hypothetical protein